MSVGLYSHTTRSTGTVLTAAIYNADHTNHITNQNPQMTGAYSDTVGQMQSTVSPGGVDTESLAGSMAGELERLRYVIKTLHGGAQWYPGSLLLNSGGAVVFNGTISPAQITSTQNNYNPSGLATANVIRLNSDARRSVTGLVAQAAGQAYRVQNVGTFPLVFTFQDAGSSAANRFAFACTLGGGQSMEIQYDGVSSIWRHISIPEPIGTIKEFAGGTVPAGHLLCDNTTYSRTTYAALFNEIGTTWGVGDGSTTFGVPDSRRRTGVGSGGTGTGTLGNAVGNVGGEETHQLTTAELAAHTHGVTDPGHFHTVNAGPSSGASGGADTYRTDSTAPTQSKVTGVTVNSAGSDTAHNNMPPSYVATKVIRYV